MAITLIPPQDTLTPVTQPGSRAGISLVPYSPSAELLASTKMAPQDFDTFRHYIARREGASYAEPKNEKGYGGHYGFNEDDVEKTAKRLGVPVPSWKEFLANPELQERFFDNYTLHNSQELLGNKVYAEANPAQRAAILAGAHLGGVTGVEKYLAGGADPGDNAKAPGGGTHISSYVNGMAQTLKTGVFTAPGWSPSERAIAAEQDKSNTDVVNMGPEEFLNLLPPLKDDEATMAKRANLRQSLLSGDNVEAIPALEVRPDRSGNLKILDHDGRNRAEAAANSGVDTIPVAIRGIPSEGSFGNISGEKTVPYAFSKIQPAKPISVAPPVQSVIPPGVAAPGVAPGRTPGTAPPPIAMPPTKPDFYPQIAAGINRAQLAPTAEPYRGLAVANPADNNTASDRIANANATSAGQVGLTPNTPQNAISSLLSAINPIGSAQAAEAPRAGPVTLIPPSEDSSSVTLTPPAASPPGPIMGGAVAPLVNFASPMLTALPADANALGQILSGRISPSDFMAARNAAMAQTQLPETPFGQAVSNMLGVPGRMLGWAAETISGANSANEKLLQYAREESELARPILTIANDILGPLSLANRSVANALSAPAKPMLERMLATPEIETARAINRVQPKELRAGGIAPATMAQRLADAQAAGKPLTPADMLVPGGPQAKLLSRALEHSPEAVADTRQFLTERTEGVPNLPGEPIGGTLERMTRDVEAALGSGSARDIGAALDKSLRDTGSLRDKEMQLLDQTKAQLDNTVSGLKTVYAPFGAKAAAKRISADPGVIRLRLLRDRREAQVKQYNTKLAKDSINRNSLNAGQRIFSPAMRAEDIDKFMAKASPEAINHFRLGVADAAQDQLRRVRTAGTEAGRVEMPQNIRNKLASTLGPGRAKEFLRGVDTEADIAKGTKNWLRDISGEDRIASRRASVGRRVAEAALHAGTGFLTGHHWLSPLYWGIRGTRNLADYIASGGALPRTGRNQAIANAMFNPNAVIDAGVRGRGLLSVPALPASREAVAAGIRRGLPATGYLTTQSPPTPGQGWMP